MRTAHIALTLTYLATLAGCAHVPVTPGDSCLPTLILAPIAPVDTGLGLASLGLIVIHNTVSYAKASAVCHPSTPPSVLPPTPSLKLDDPTEGFVIPR